MILGIVGRTEDAEGNRCSLGTGKDTVADALVTNHEFVKVALADPMKRFVKELYGFTYEQLWGPSFARNAVDTRYPRQFHVFTGRSDRCACCGAVYYEERGWAPTQCYLTPRYALQMLGTEWGKFCFRDTWMRYLLTEVAPPLLMDVAYDRDYDKHRTHVYRPELGLVDRGKMDGVHGDRIRGLVISDIRFDDELKYLKSCGGKAILVVRKVEALPEGPDLGHASECSLNDYTSDDPIWDDVLPNFGTVDDLVLLVRGSVNTLRGRV